MDANIKNLANTYFTGKQILTFVVQTYFMPPAFGQAGKVEKAKKLQVDQARGVKFQLGEGGGKANIVIIHVVSIYVKKHE